MVVLGSGNLGLVYLMEERRRLTREEIDERHPRLLPALREHPHVGWLLVRSERDGPLALGAHGTHYLADGRVEGEDPLASFSPNAPQHLLRTDGFEHVADIMVGSFYDPALDEGCAFEELISFHGGIGGEQTRPFLLAPVELPLPDEPIVGAAAVHGVLSGWRRRLNGAACDRGAGGRAARCGGTVIPATETRAHARRAPPGRAQLRARARADHRRLRLHLGRAEQRRGPTARSCCSRA